MAFFTGFTPLFSLIMQASEMLSSDVTMDGELIPIDPDICHREWDPSLRILPMVTAGSGHHGLLVISR
jgi:hypothetical protein